MSAVVQLFPSKQVEPPVQEARVADCDDGYTRLANDLYEELIGADLTRNQAKVAHAICRKTYGFNKKSDRISDSQLSELTKLPRQKVNKAKNELIAMNVIIRTGHEIGPNKNLSEWKIECHQNSDTVTKTVTKNVTKTVTHLSPKQGHTKDTIQKTINTKDKNISAEPSCDDSTLHDDFPVEQSVTEIQKPEPAPTEPSVIDLPLNTGKPYSVTQAFSSQMQALYPAVNIEQEFRSMLGWLIANPTKRKTKSGVTRFINSWLARCQDRGGSSGLAPMQTFEKRETQADKWRAAFNDTSWANDLGDY